MVGYGVDGAVAEELAAVVVAVVAAEGEEGEEE